MNTNQAPIYLQYGDAENPPMYTARARAWSRDERRPAPSRITRTPLKVLAQGRWRRVLKDANGYHVTINGERVGITVTE